MPLTATFVVKDNATPTPNVVPGTKVRIYSALDVFQTELLTDSLGTAQFVLAGSISPGTLYIIRLIPPTGYSIPVAGGTQTVRVIEPLGINQTNIFDFVVTLPPAVPSSLNPLMCRLSGRFVDPSLRPIKNLTLLFHPMTAYPSYVIAGTPFSGDPTIVDGNIMASERTIKADADGYVELELPRKGKFSVFIQGLDAPDHTLSPSIYIPDAAGALLNDVLFPYVKQVTYGAASVNVAHGATVDLDVTPLASNLQDIDDLQSINKLLEFTVANPVIATVEMVDDFLRIKGLVAGSTTLVVARRVDTSAPRSPAIAALIIVPSVPTITVT